MLHDYVHHLAAWLLCDGLSTLTQSHRYLQRQHGDLCYGRHGTVHLMCYKKRQAGGVDVVVGESFAIEKGRRRSGSVLHAIPLRALQIQVPRYSSILGVTHQREQVKAAVEDRTPPFFFPRSFLPFVFTRSLLLHSWGGRW
jgi:hypothetical protein